MYRIDIRIVFILKILSYFYLIIILQERFLITIINIYLVIYFKNIFQVNDRRCEEERADNFVAARDDRIIIVKTKDWDWSICDKQPKEQIKVNFIFYLIYSYPLYYDTVKKFVFD